MKVIKGHTLIEMDWKEKDGKDGYEKGRMRRGGGGGETRREMLLRMWKWKWT